MLYPFFISPLFAHRHRLTPIEYSVSEQHEDPFETEKGILGAGSSGCCGAHTMEVKITFSAARHSEMA